MCPPWSRALQAGSEDTEAKKTPACAAGRGLWERVGARLPCGECALHVRMHFAPELIGSGGEGRDVVRDLRGGHDLALELLGAGGVLDGDVVGRGLLVVE